MTRNACAGAPSKAEGPGGVAEGESLVGRGSSARLEAPPMDEPFDDPWTEALRRMSRPLSSDELHRRSGRLRSINLHDMAELIEKAVNRTLMARTIGGLEDDVDGFSADARREFLRLVRQASEAEAGAAEVEARAETELERLKRELGQRRREAAELQARQARLDDEPDDELARELRRLFASWGGSPDRPSALEREVISLTIERLRQERRRGERARLVEHQREIDKLERRVSKLNALLGQTEAELARVAHQKGATDGIASIYGTVQGLASADDQYERKRELMTAIFQANLDMRLRASATAS